MARRQFLWIDPRGADCYFPAPGNIKCGSGDKGTLAIWQHTPTAMRYTTQSSCWRVKVDASNYMEQYQGRSFRVGSGGVSRTISVPDYMWTQYGGHGYVWELLVYTWDFTGGAGQGVLHAYWDGAEAGTAVTTASAPVGTPAQISLGPPAGTTFYQDKHAITSLAVWDGVMTSAQVGELYAQSHRHRIKASDGTGALLLHASFDGRFNADVAAGSATFGAGGAADRYCLVDDGLREPSVRRLLLGTPRHDLSEDDRIPLYAALTPSLGSGQEQYTVATNNTNYSRLQVTAGYTQNKPVGVTYAGAPVYPSSTLTVPATYRQRLHVLNDSNPKSTFIRIGPVDYYHAPMKVGTLYDQYGSGRTFLVVSDAGNSPTQVKTDLSSTYPNGYWAGAEVTFLSGACAGRRLKTTAYNSTTKALTIEGALPATPAAGDVGVVDFRAVVQGTLSRTNNEWGKRIPEMTMDAWLWEAYGEERYFTELEWCYAGLWNEASLGTINLLRYDRGRTAYMDGSPGDSLGQAFMYGRPAVWQTDPAFYCDLLLERVEVEGPAAYQLLTRDSSGHGPSYADNFMVTAPSGEATKVWRKRNVTRTRALPTKNADPAAALADIQSPNTWRHTVAYPPVPVEYDAPTETVIALIGGTDSGGVKRYGYCKGRWNETTGRISWTDEVPPPGKSNPFLAASGLRPDKATDAAYVVGAGGPTSVLRGPDGESWYMVYGSQQANVDHYLTYLLGPCEDRWSFSRDKHWWSGNPLMSILGGPDRLAPESNGAGQWVNRDAKYLVTENPYAKDPSRRYWGWARGKTISHKWRSYASDCRPIVGMRGSDLRSMMPLPHGNQLTPLVGMQMHAGDCYVNGQADCLVAYTDTAVGASSGVYCFVSEDGVHWQAYADHTEWLPMQQLPGEANRLKPGRPFRLGNRTVYYYSGGVLNYAWCRVDGECWYSLSSGQTTGLLETPLIEKPAEGWGPLEVNSAPGNGSIRVEVLDANETVLPGFSAAECSAVPDSCQHRVRWGDRGLEDVTADTIRLRYTFACATGAAPKLYRWGILDATPVVQVVEHLPVGDDVATDSVVSATFGDRMDRETTESAFVLMPRPEGGFVWSNEGRTLTFVPDGELDANVEYAVSVAATAASESSGALGVPYEWQFTTASRPTASELRVGGEADPVNVTDPSPEFTWTYTDPRGLAQTAYQLIVASSREAIEANLGDVLDSGVVESADPLATYAGEALADNSLYYWRVRVRNAEGAWSEEW